MLMLEIESALIPTLSNCGSIRNVQAPGQPPSTAVVYAQSRSLTLSDGVQGLLRSGLVNSPLSSIKLPYRFELHQRLRLSHANGSTRAR